MISRNLCDSFSHAIDGLVYSFRSQRNMKIHGLATVLVVIAGLFFHLGRMEWGLVATAIFIVLVSETMNTAIEKTVDLVTDEYHPLAKKAKNLAAGATLLAALGAVIIGIIVFGTHVLGVIKG